MKVRITKALKDSYWYSDRIGEIFEVEQHKHYNYKWVLVENNSNCLDKQDCEEVKEVELKVGDRVEIISATYKSLNGNKSTIDIIENNRIYLKDSFTSNEGGTVYWYTADGLKLLPTTMSYVEALKAALDGQEVRDTTWPCKHARLIFNGVKFMVKNDLYNSREHEFDYDKSIRQWEIYKPQPKFSVGDVVVNDNVIFLIAEVLDNGYKLRCTTNDVLSGIYTEDSLRPYCNEK